MDRQTDRQVGRQIDRQTDRLFTLHGIDIHSTKIIQVFVD